MKKVLILPSPTGSGDLMIANELAAGLGGDYAVEIIVYPCNQNSTFAKSLQATTVLWPEELMPSHSSDYNNQIARLTNAIAQHPADFVIALNEVFFGLAANLARKRVIQLTHFSDEAAVLQGREVLSYFFTKAGFPNFQSGLRLSQQAFIRGDYSILSSIGKVAADRRQKLRFKLLARSRRYWTWLTTGRKPPSELMERYRHLIATNYLSQLSVDETIVHSIFPVSEQVQTQFNGDRAFIGRSPVVVCNSFTPESLPALVKTQGEIKEEVCNKYFGCSSQSRVVLVTFGGIDHPITDGVKRMASVLERSCATQKRGDFLFLVTGRVIDTQRHFFESIFRNNHLFVSGDVKFIGSIQHDEHLKAIVASDLVLTQPGYSTLCEVAGARKPCILFYGMAPYYEQYVNFISANHLGLCLKASNDKPWMQVGEFKTFGSSNCTGDDELQGFLSCTLERLKNSDDGFTRLASIQEASLNRHPHDIITAVKQTLQRIECSQNVLV